MKNKYINMLKDSISWLTKQKGVEYTTVLWLVVFIVTPCLAKIFTMKNMVLIMVKVLYKFNNIYCVFMVLPMIWSEDRTMSTQVELQLLDETALAFMFKKRSKYPSITRLRNKNLFLLVECISIDWGENSLAWFVLC